MIIDCGTYPYKAPELHLLGAGFYEADLWALGITIYELLVGKRPWRIYEKSKMCTAYIEEYPDNFDESAKDFIERCIEIDPSKRIGCGKNEDLEKVIFEHEFFKGKIDISNIHELTPPIDPEIVEKIIKRNKELEQKAVGETDEIGKKGIVESININQTKMTISLLFIIVLYEL